MRKISLELPKYRLQMNFRLVKRRKPLVAEPLIPNLKSVKKKYRAGSLVGRYFRHVFEHKNIQKVFGSSMAIIVMGTTFLPQTNVNAQEPGSEITIQAQTTLITEKGVQSPIDHLKINQGYTAFHPGVDLGGQIGEPVKPIKPGKVVFAGYTRDGYGNNVIIDHGNGIESLYAHLSRIEVKVGETVSMTTEIGRVGRTGHATGPHLHLEVRVNGKKMNPLILIGR